MFFTQSGRRPKDVLTAGFDASGGKAAGVPIRARAERARA